MAPEGERRATQGECTALLIIENGRQTLLIQKKKHRIFGANGQFLGLVCQGER